ncbi:flavin reductase family protein [Specibacter cremeus]|uniref:flavin reductase family protein n=1 Tax=Specibacter cremeus TaxID=1629051 RepID=UPI000F794F04|nr:flavin reductase family protein [Specibacter cremeus]
MELPPPPHEHLLSRPAVSDVDIAEYRRLGAEAAASVAVVCTSWRGRDYAATVSAHLSVSYDPPTLLVSLYEGSRIAAAVTGAGHWTLSLLAAGQRRTANWLASPGSPVEGLMESVEFRRGRVTGSPVIDGALAWFELETTAVHPAATHLLVVGAVVGMGERGAGQPGEGPLLHYGGEYHRLA